MASEPKYIVIKNKLKQLILNGEYDIGSKIPSEAELKDKFNVSRHTIRQSISELANDGYLRREQGSGTYVSNQYQIETKETSQKTIGVITTYLSDYIFPSIIRGIEDELSKKGYALLLSSTQNNVENEKRSLEMMLEKHIDGLIVEPTKSAELNPNLNYYLRMQERGIPYVSINASYEELDAPEIRMNDILASEKLTSHLLELGHTRICMITKTDDLQGKERMKGFIRAYSKVNKTFDGSLMITFDTEHIGELPKDIDRVLKLENSPTAFVCYNDQIAIKVIERVTNSGKEVPLDISVVSHDNSLLSTATDIKLTSINHPKEQLGRDAANWIIQAIEKNSFKQQSIIYEPELIMRSSTSKNNEID
ncbi:GntR family transcriptional regulator [Carnobacterium antarcticum]|uniref:GntR family transcriptional regulator n=1 Tax=Carnobacterium antarcticum TaxID=2126436 RepID=A0ABW4NLT9_9LACT|nr:GntR family transcriptional regulator [Carnobacterium sp. CP1]ALV22110.1 Transcriptional repressor of arabinoside utilization operon, GntR [Carnobacterium sp. CP1]